MDMKILGMLLALVSFSASVSFADEVRPWVGNYLGRILRYQNAPLRYDDVILQIGSSVGSGPEGAVKYDVELKLMDAEGFGDNMVLVYTATASQVSDKKFVITKSNGPNLTSTVSIELLADGTFSGTLVHDHDRPPAEEHVTFHAFFRLVKF